MLHCFTLARKISVADSTARSPKVFDATSKFSHLRTNGVTLSSELARFLFQLLFIFDRLRLKFLLLNLADVFVIAVAGLLVFSENRGVLDLCHFFSLFLLCLLVAQFCYLTHRRKRLVKLRSKVL